MCEEGSPIAFESQEGLQGRRAKVLKRSFEVSKSFKFIESHSNDSNSFKVIAFRCSFALLSRSSAVDGEGFNRVIWLHWIATSTLMRQSR